MVSTVIKYSKTSPEPLIFNKPLQVTTGVDNSVPTAGDENWRGNRLPED